MSVETSQVDDGMATSAPSAVKKQQESKQPRLCCQYLREGKCKTPRPPCRLRHEPDDGITPCFFGACCRNGHKNRVLGGMTAEQRDAFWKEFNAKRGNTVAAYEDPAKRDVTLLRSQLEPWSTGKLRLRLASIFGEDHNAMDEINRGQVMLKLLQHYETCGKQRKTVRVLGTPVDPNLCDQLLTHLRAWSDKHKVNSRPSINASSYMILRSPSEFTQQNQHQSPGSDTPVPVMSKNARKAAKKLREYQALWDLAKETIATVDPTYAESFSALAVTKNFTGSPHIDKQNTGPFYGLALGNYDDGTGGVCVEVDAFTVAHVNTKYRLAKVDGRRPHWVAPYTYNNLDDQDGSKEQERYRYSLIYYFTTGSYSKPGPAYFGEVMEEEIPNMK